MSIQFNKTSNTALYIQGLLRKNYIPSCLTITPWLRSQLQAANVDIKGISNFQNQQLYLGDQFQKSWEFGARIPNLTYNLHSNQTYYSTETHEHLGWYLRAYRDYYGVDVMGLYNCFSGRLLSKIVLPVKNPGDNQFVRWWKGGSAENVQITCFPIQVGSKYRVKISNSVVGPILVQPLFFNGTDLIKCSPNNSGEALYLSSCQAKMDSSFVYDASLEGICSSRDHWKQILTNHRYLYLFIQVPTTEDLKISVIEEAGYVNASHRSLLEDNSTIGSPCSDKLLEYLVGYAITPASTILPNIELIQRIISSDEFKSLYGAKLSKYSLGIFDDAMRKFIYTSLLDPEHTNKWIARYMPNGYIPDFTGCVDRDVEQLLWTPLSPQFKEQLLSIVGE